MFTRAKFTILGAAMALGVTLGASGAQAEAKGLNGRWIKLKVMLPAEPNPELEAFLSKWSPGTSYDPRPDMQP